MKKAKKVLTIAFNEEVSDLLKEAFANLKENAWKDLGFLKELITGDLAIKIPLAINIPEAKKPKYKNPFSMLILKKVETYSRRKLPSFLCEDVGFEDVTIWAFNLGRGKEPLLFMEVSSFQAVAKAYFKQEEEIKYFEKALSFPFVQKNKKYYQAINLAIFLALNEFYFENNPLLFALTTIAKPRYAKLLKKREYLEKLVALCKYTREETKAINNKIFFKEFTIEEGAGARLKNKRRLFTYKIRKDLQFLRDFEISFYRKRSKIIAEVHFQSKEELLFFKSKKIVENKLKEVLFQYILYGKLVKEINSVFKIAEEERENKNIFRAKNIGRIKGV